MEMRSSKMIHAEDLPIEAVINAAGEGNPLQAGNNPVISDTNESAGDNMIHSHHSESIEVNDVDSESRLIHAMTPTMKNMVHLLNAQTRETMFNIRDVLADARRRDSEEIAHAVANSIPSVSTNIIPAVQDMVSQMKDSIKVAMSEVVQQSQTLPRQIPSDHNIGNIPSCEPSIDVQGPDPSAQDTPIPRLTKFNSYQCGSARSHSPRHNPNNHRGRRVHQHSDTDQSDSGSERDTLMLPSRRSIGRNSGLRLPIFTGKDWKIWHNRFEDLSRIHGWTDEHKQMELLPKLQGTAGEFVYGQLSRAIRENYSTPTVLLISKS